MVYVWHGNATSTSRNESCNDEIPPRQHLAGLHCVNLTSKRALVIYLPQIDVDITKDGNLGNEWTTGTMTDSVGKMQPVKVSATQIFYNFDDLACPYSNFSKRMKGVEVKKISIANTVLPPDGNDLLHVVSLSSTIPVSYLHRLQLGKVTNLDLRLNAESYYALIGLWTDTLVYQSLLQQWQHQHQQWSKFNVLQHVHAPSHQCKTLLWLLWAPSQMVE
eukprot:8632718-Ditylum_brightwellii.AAC.1